MATVELTTELRRWNLATRIGFRFLFVYLLLSILSPFSQLGGRWLWNHLGIIESVATWWMQAVGFVGERVFSATITTMRMGSGDSVFNYLEVFCWAAIAAGATIVWSLVDRKRPSYPRLFEVLRFAVRFVLAYQMISYGAAKVLPGQFGTLSPGQLVKPVGDLSPMGLLWAFMAASPAYAFFGGAAELLGGVLLVFRRTALLGALVTAAVMTQVVMLNLCYDVCVKLLSSHLLAMAIFLALPDLKRLWDFFVVGRATGPAPSLPQFKRRWLNWSIAAATIGLFGLLTVRVFIDEYSICELCGQFGPRPRLQAVWDVVEFQCDGRVIPPLRTDATCWKQVVIQNEPGYGLMMDFESMTGMAGGWFLDIVEESRRMSLADLTTGKPAATLTYEEPAAETLVLSGVINGKKLHVTLRRAPADRFLLVNRGFHWIN